MVKRTRYRHHPVQTERGLFVGPGQEYSGSIMLEAISALLNSGTLASGRSSLDISALCVAAGIDIPEGAAAIIVEVAVRDSGAGTSYMAFGYGGLVDLANFPGRGQTAYCYPTADDVWLARLMILTLSDVNIVDVLVAATGGATFDYEIRLLGWVLKGSGYTRPTGAYADLKAIATIVQ